MQKLKIEIISDIVCPWCVVGYYRLREALSNMQASVDVDIVFYPFELNPNMEIGGENLKDYLMVKYQISQAQSIQARDNLIKTGRGLGFQFDFYEEMRIYNTFLAHQLLYFAKLQGRQTVLKLQLFREYFTNRQTIDQIHILSRIAGKVGLDVGAASQTLQDQTYAQNVREEQQSWLQKGLTAVPGFIFNETTYVSGAQESATFQKIITDVLR